ncbi:MAG: helix-turn-helix transcriptional regulator, partial [Clostridia bacterium]|nr:helix-turn-helix transcriptional regulator [Clostridia bacterium]
MKSGNICRFINESVVGRLETKNFVLETVPEAINRSDGCRFHMAVLVVFGRGTVEFNGRSFSLSKGTLIFGFKGERVSLIEGEGLRYLYISFDGARAEELFSRFGITAVNRCFGGFEGVIPFWQSCISSVSDGSVDLISESALLYAFSRLEGITSRNSDAVSEAVEIIEKEFSDADISLETVAERLGYNSKYLSHAFKEKMGMGFSVYLRTVRIKHAVFLMEHGVESVKNVAFLCGFSDPLYFSTVFK